MNKHNILSLAGNVAMAGLTFFSQALLYHMVNPNIMGSWVVFLAGIGFVEAIRSGIIQSGLIRFHAGAGQNEARKVIGAAWFISFTMTTLFVVINIPLYFWSSSIHDAGWQIFTRWFSISLVCSLPYNFATWLLQSEQRFDKILYLRIINQGSYVLLIIAAYFLHFTALESIFICYTGSMLISSLYSIIARYTKMNSLFGTEKHFVSQLFNFGKYSMGTGVGAILLTNSDTFIINAFLGPKAVAIYNIPQKIISVLEIPVRSFIGTAFPAMSVFATENKLDEVTRIMKKYAGSLTISLLPLIIAIFIFSTPIVTIPFGMEYLQSSIVLKVFMIYAALLPMDRFLGVTLDIMNRPHLNFLKTLFMLIVNVAGDIAGILIFKNVISVAAASVLTFLAGIIFGHLALRRYLKYSLWDIMQIGFSESNILAQGIFRKIFGTKNIEA